MKKIVVLGVFGLLFGATPTWFAQPQTDTSKVFGFGSAKTLELAKKKAISDLVNTLRVSVRTSFEQAKMKKEGQVSTSSLQNIDLQSQFQDLMNVKQINSECEDEVCYVGVEIAISDLLGQLRRKIERKKEEILTLSSPFAYTNHRAKLEKIYQDYDLYVALGGEEFAMPKLQEKPTFDVIFEYDGNFSKSFQSILEQTINGYLTKQGTISSDSPWKVVIEVLKEDNGVALDLAVSYQDKVVHTASVFDRKKPSISHSFFAKRLGVQAYKKMAKWGE